MQALRTFSRPIAIVVTAAFLTTTAPIPGAWATMVGTDSVADQTVIGDKRDKLFQFFSRDDVQKEMQSLGVSPEEAKERIASLSDEEIAKVSGRLEQMPAGQGVFGAIIGAGLIVFIVLLLTDIFGFTNVFSFVNSKQATTSNR